MALHSISHTGIHTGVFAKEVGGGGGGFCRVTKIF